MLSVPEVGEVLGISRAGAYELVRSAGFPHIKIGNRIVVPRDKFIAWIDRNSEVDEYRQTVTNKTQETNNALGAVGGQFPGRTIRFVQIEGS